MKLQGRLTGTIALVAVLLLIPAGLAVERLTALHQLAVEGREQHARATLALGRFETALSQLDRHQRTYLATADPSVMEAAEVAVADLEALVPTLRGTFYVDGNGGRFMAPVVEGLAGSNQRIEDLVRAEEIQEATDFFQRTAPLMDEARRRLDLLAQGIDRHAERDFERAHQIISTARAAVPVLLLVCLLLAVLLGAWTIQVIVAPVRRLAGAMTQVTGGSLEAPDDLPYDRKDEIGELSRSFQTMTRRLAELDRMKAEFLGVASHELKTPIAVVSGYNELIEEELAGELTEQQRAILRGIAEQTTVMRRLVSRLMDISRLESGTYELELQSAHVEDLLIGLVRSYEVVADRKDVRIHTHVHASAPETAVMDQDLIRDEVLGNLLSNAVKFVPEGEEVRVSVWGEGGTVVFEVSDTGPGIPEAHRPHIFEKHYQVERSRRMGSGLGLAIAREMVELHGGRLELVDKPGRGATFHVRLPMDPRETPRSQAPEIAFPAARPMPARAAVRSRSRADSRSA